MIVPVTNEECHPNNAEACPIPNIQGRNVHNGICWSQMDYWSVGLMYLNKCVLVQSHLPQKQLLHATSFAMNIYLFYCSLPWQCEHVWCPRSAFTVLTYNNNRRVI